MNRERRKRYKRLREIRRERDYQIGKLQYANRPFSFPSFGPNGKRRVLTTSKFIRRTNMTI